jgi:tRNA pseudouridine38-40 synthase
MLYRYKIIIEYDGTPFLGFQKQKGSHLLTIQGSIEEALLRCVNQPIKIEGAGRTDSGVHALGQVIHFDLPNYWDSFKLSQAIQFHLKNMHNGNIFIRIINVQQVNSEFHARFSAISRSYIYKIINNRYPPALDRNRAWHVIKPLNMNHMEEGANHLIGTHDFTSFRDSECQAKTPIRMLHFFNFNQNEDIITVHISAKSFLHHQVRIMMGTLVAVGKGDITPNDVLSILNKKNRCIAGVTAPPQGLYFKEVVYN